MRREGYKGHKWPAWLGRDEDDGMLRCRDLQGQTPHNPLYPMQAPFRLQQPSPPS
jgi:hypothetical protein